MEKIINGYKSNISELNELYEKRNSNLRFDTVYVYDNSKENPIFVLEGEELYRTSFNTEIIKKDNGTIDFNSLEAKDVLIICYDMKSQTRQMPAKINVMNVYYLGVKTTKDLSKYKPFWYDNKR
ncbi:hypothetical protein EI71_00498 [Anaeroplasma bactoclasticum]|jgi:hypothetical protein|uniref:Uncharacterized protein n=1 Tax=Anaeroplasma bactoclasticum TaxID=2088 RepID=A0A397S058_9MOLU|nr:hypothetical protein [Anaeroplasma bactoclasticum]RIA78186.1 hypothetical protein EI71_00498 [Anaeroplasma bactoclasticum]